MRIFNKNNRFLRIMQTFVLTPALVLSLVMTVPEVSNLSRVFADNDVDEENETTEENEVNEGIDLYTLAVENGVEVVDIYSAEDLVALSNRCTIDSASSNMYVRLMNDLELSSSGFEGIRIFAGIFDGQKHVITGYNLTGDGYSDGFFRYIAEDSFVINTTFSGSCNSENMKEFAGGVCGINRGTISGCYFVGIVEGEAGVGGLCGENTSTGVILNCYSSGLVTGQTMIGGVVGTNHGIIDNCQNNASVNAKEEWIDKQDEDGLEWVKKLLETETVEVRSTGVTDIGGVCGYSDGLLTDCKNNGEVGYAHSGYNVGGICGRQAGIIISCTNKGIVKGRKDVGGIVGQMEPYIEIDVSKSIKDDVHELHDMINGFLDDLSAAQKGISADVDELRKHADDALDYGENVSDALVDFANDNIDSANDLQDRIEYVIRELPNVTKEIENALNMTSTINSDLKKVTEDLDIVSKLKESTYSETDHSRLALATSVGGQLRTSQSNPSEGDVVTITVDPDNGYELDSITVNDASGKKIAYVMTGDEVSFTMPSPNVIVSARFKYVGEYVPVSNEGGRIKVSESGSSVDITVIPDSGYSFSSVQVGSDSYPKASFTLNADNEYELSVPASRTGKPVLVKTTFSETDATYGVATVQSTGGYLTTDMSSAKAGETVTVTVHELRGYKHNTPVVSGGVSVSSTGNLNEYSFVMPGNDVKISAKFEYQPDADTNVYAESNAGGTVATTASPGTNNYVVTLTAAPGYELVPAKALTISGGTSRDIPLSDLNGSGPYTYTFNVNDFTKPVKVTGYFQECVAGSYTISKTDGTGGYVVLTTDTSAVDEDVVFTATPENGYRLGSLKVTNLSSMTDIPVVEEASDNTYSFTMPAANVKVTASFEPVVVVIESNEGGSATYTANGTTVKMVIKPDTGYVMEGGPVVTDAAGKQIPVSKKNAASSVYEFTLTSDKEPAHVQIKFNRSSEYQTVKDAEDNISDNADRLNDTMSQMQDTAEALEDLLTDEDGNPLSYQDIIGDADKTRELSRLLVDLAKELADAGEESAEIVSSLNTIVTIMTPYVEDAMKGARDDSNKALDDMEAMSKHLENASKVLDNILTNLGARADVNFAKLPEDFTENMDSFFDELHLISDALGKINADADSYTTKLTNDMRNINNKLSDIFDKIVDWTSGDPLDLKEEVMGHEMSDEEIEEAVLGKVTSSVNQGSVSGDINVGGITGSMAIDDEDPEGNAAGSVDWSVLNSYVSQCVLVDCENNGTVSSKKDGAGCIVGYMALGTLKGCRAFGSVSSSEGNYTGGICGESRGAIRECYSLCSVKSEGNYVGGICGYGTVIKDCYAMTLISGDCHKIGEIAGQIYMDEEDEGVINQENVCRNYYVSDTYFGVDDISYVGIAEPMTYEELLSVTGIPNAFRHLKLSYIVDDKVYLQQEIPYGSDLSKITLPAVPEKDGKFGKWSNLDCVVMQGNPTITAEYFTSITTLQSGEGIEDSAYIILMQNSENGEGEDAKEGSGNAGENSEEDEARLAIKPNALLDGAFDDSMKLHAEEQEVILSETDLAEIGRHDYMSYNVWIEGPEGPVSIDKSKLRLCHNYKNGVKVYRQENGKWVEIPSTEYGNYVQVIFEGRENSYLIVSQAIDQRWINYLIIGAVAAVCLIVIIILCRVYVKGKKKQKLLEEEYIENKKKEDHEKLEEEIIKQKDNNEFLE